jgi:DNA (cytosine-5)-methyltransferase 1
MSGASSFSFYEFFAGGGMCRAGLGSSWDCVFANDIDSSKAASYRRNWGAEHFQLKDVRKVAPGSLLSQAAVIG